MKGTKSKYYLKGRVAPDGVSLQFDFPGTVRQLFFPLVDKDLCIEVSKFSKSRSLKQNRWLWGVAYVLIKDWLAETQGEAYTLDDIHAHNLQVIQPRTTEFKNLLGEEVIVVKQKKTSQMSTVEFNEMKERLQAWYADVGLEIPDPVRDSLTTDYVNWKPQKNNYR